MTEATVAYTERLLAESWELFDDKLNADGFQLPIEKKNYQVKLNNARSLLTSLDKEGFFLTESTSKIQDYIKNEELIRDHYYKETVQLLQSIIPNVTRVFVFDHTIRNTSKQERIERSVRPPADMVHGDYTANSGFTRMQQLIPDEAAELLKQRFMIINVWRGIKKVESYPLAFVDATTTDSQDFLNIKRIHKGRVGETQQVKFNPKHTWYYYPDLDTNEALVFKTFDSLTEGVSRFTPHTAVNLHENIDEANIPVRESIETRSLVFLK